MCLAFVIDESTFGSSRSIPLKPGGADIEVTLENRLEYISYYTQYVLCGKFGLVLCFSPEHFVLHGMYV